MSSSNLPVVSNGVKIGTVGLLPNPDFETYPLPRLAWARALRRAQILRRDAEQWRGRDPDYALSLRNQAEVYQAMAEDRPARIFVYPKENQ